MKQLVTIARLKQLCPHGRDDLIEAVADGWQEMIEAGISTPLRVAHFIATIATETGEFRAIEENLNYTAERIRQVWPHRFRTLGSAIPYAHNPEKLANKVYGGRLGNTQPGDGWRYRGGGFIQTTGRDNYRACGHESDPEALRMPGAGFSAAVKFWVDNHINTLADADDPRALRKRVNGGAEGLDRYMALLAEAKRIFVEAGAVDWGAAPPPADDETSVALLKRLQFILNAAGHAAGSADGLWGPKTRQGLNAFLAGRNMATVISQPSDSDLRAYISVLDPLLKVHISTLTDRTNIAPPPSDPPAARGTNIGAGVVSIGAAGALAGVMTGHIWGGIAVIVGLAIVIGATWYFRAQLKGLW